MKLEPPRAWRSAAVTCQPLANPSTSCGPPRSTAWDPGGGARARGGHRLPTLVHALAQHELEGLGGAGDLGPVAVDVHGRRGAPWRPAPAGSPWSCGRAGRGGEGAPIRRRRRPPSRGRAGRCSTRCRWSARWRTAGCDRPPSAPRAGPRSSVMPLASGPHGTSCASPPSRACWVEPTTATLIGWPSIVSRLDTQLPGQGGRRRVRLDAGDADLGDAQRQFERARPSSSSPRTRGGRR